jgi:hypothetical protein
MEKPSDGRSMEYGQTLEWIRRGKERAWLAVNAAMIETYAALGAFLSQQVREKGWGGIEIQGWSNWLIANEAGLLGFSVGNLMKMKAFHEVWSETGPLPPVVLELNWSCHLVLLNAGLTHRELTAYMEEAVQKKWTPEVLEARIQRSIPPKRKGRR